jgi:hypothetical protein
MMRPNSPALGAAWDWGIAAACPALVWSARQGAIVLRDPAPGIARQRAVGPFGHLVGFPGFGEIVFLLFVLTHAALSPEMRPQPRLAGQDLAQLLETARREARGDGVGRRSVARVIHNATAIGWVVSRHDLESCRTG